MTTRLLTRDDREPLGQEKNTHFGLSAKGDYTLCLSDEEEQNKTNGGRHRETLAPQPINPTLTILTELNRSNT